MDDMMSATEVLARLRIDAASEDFEGAQLGPVAVRKLLRHVAVLESDRWRQLCRIHSNRAADLSRERDELAAKYDELLVALHGIGRALGIEEADRSPYSITCGVLAMANRLAEIERAEPVMWMARKADGRIAAWTSASDETIRLAREVGTEVRPLYACPQPPASEPARELPNSITAAIADFREACIACAISECSDHDRDPDYTAADRAEERMRMAIDAVASAEPVGHLYTGDCPDLDQPDARDTTAIAAINGAAAELQRLKAEREALAARIADLEARAAAAAAEMTAWAERDAQRDWRERAQREMALHAMAEASDLRALLAEALAGKDDLRAEAERLRAVLCDIDRQLGHDDRDDAIREQITEALGRSGAA